MGVHSENFPWLNYYGHYNFFEARMKDHSNVVKITKEQKYTGVYNIVTLDGNKLRVFICDCYIFSSAEYYETIENIGSVNAVIINSSWCSYTTEAKKHCRDNDVGIFKFGDFMAALNRPDFYNYLTTREKETFEANGWS